MKFISILASGLLSLLLAWPLFAQLQPTQPLSSEPASVGTDFAEEVSRRLFTPLSSAARAVGIDQGIEHYQVLAVEEELRSQLLLRAPATLHFQLPAARQAARPLELRLHRVYPFAPDFVLRTASGKLLDEASLGLFYQGTVVGVPGAHVVISILANEIQGLVALPGQPNQVLGPLPVMADAVPHNQTAYVLYEDAAVFQQQDFSCGTADSAIPYEVEELRLSSGSARSVGCVGVYLEVDYDIYTNKGGSTQAAAYVSAAFNEVMQLYAAIDVGLHISEIFVWDQPSPYAGTSSGTLLSQFQNHRQNFNGDIAQLLSYKASGGVAILNGLCHPFTAARMSFSSIGSSFQNTPTYSWTVMVMAHEFGHLLGSQHTHACAWNGNGTAIDGCAGFTEGNCPNPGPPSSGGGSIMSYCHITPTGISFATGFGQQPGAVIANRVASAACIAGSTCGGNPPPPPPPPPTGGGNGGGGENPDEPADSSICETNQVFLQLTLDHFGMETTWQIEDANQQVVASGGPYPKKKAGLLLRDTFCLPDGCYQIRILDEDGDGICCQYGQGSYRLLDSLTNVLANGAEFDSVEVKDFCLPYQEPPSGEDCISLNFNEYPVISYGINQDAGVFALADGGRELYIANNAWKAIELPYTITPHTVVELEFRSTIEGEIHGFGFDDDLGISPAFTFRLYGTQNWGISDFATYNGSGNWQAYRIPVGAFLSGEAAYFFFAADHDLGARNGNSYFRNIRIYEGENCEHNPEDLAPQAKSTPMPDPLIFPNPASNHIELSSGEAGEYQIYSLSGQLLSLGTVPAQGSLRIATRQLPAGTYLLSFQGQQQQFTQRFVVL